MAEVRTRQATVKRLAGSKGVAVEELVRSGDREFKSFFTVWLGEDHGLRVGDSARFIGELSVKRRDTDNGVFVDLNLNRASIVDGTLARAEVDWDRPF